MSFLAREIATVGLQEGLASQRAPHGLRVAVLGGHALFEDIRQEARDAHILLGSLDAGQS